MKNRKSNFGFSYMENLYMFPATTKTYFFLEKGDIPR